MPERVTRSQLIARWRGACRGKRLLTLATFVTQPVNLPGTVEAILQLQPLTTNIALVFGLGPTGGRLYQDSEVGSVHQFRQPGFWERCRGPIASSPFNTSPTVAS